MKAWKWSGASPWVWVVAAVAAFVPMATPAVAIAAPVAGTAALNGKPIVLTHVLAKLHDNAEGVVGKPLLIVVADRPIPPGALNGIGETVASQLAMAGKLRGLLFRIDPARPYLSLIHI